MHAENGASPDLPIVPAPEMDGMRASSLPAFAGGKRKRDDVEDPSLDLEVEQGNGVDMHDELKRLRREAQEKDRRLEELERIVAGLQQAIPQPPGP